jgi:hypothetical protein
MGPEGMVHALEKASRLLTSAGCVLDIHPLPIPPSIEVRLGDHVELAGWIREEDDYVQYSQAEEAVAEIVRRGIAVIEDRRVFPFVTHAQTLSDLQIHLSEEWQDAFIEEQTAGRIEDLLRTQGHDREILVRETVSIARLRPVGPRGAEGEAERRDD